MRHRKIGGELGDQGRYARRKIATVVAVTYPESASSVPRIPEIEDYVQDVVRRRFGGLGRRSQLSVVSSAEQRMDFEWGGAFQSKARLKGCISKGMEQQYCGLFESFGVARLIRPFPHICGDCKVTNE